MSGANQKIRSKMKRRQFVVLVLTLAPALFSCKQEKLFYFDFENDEELDRIRWECHELYTLVPDHVAHGKSSLRLEMFSGKYPGLKISKFDPDWSNFSVLRAEIYNPQNDSLVLHLRVDDLRGSQPYADRFNSRMRLPPGWTHFVLPLDSLITSGTRRKMNHASIEKIDFFIPQPTEPVTLFFDHLRLE